MSFAAAQCMHRSAVVDQLLAAGVQLETRDASGATAGDLARAVVGFFLTRVMTGHKIKNR